METSPEYSEHKLTKDTGQIENYEANETYLTDLGLEGDAQIKAYYEKHPIESERVKRLFELLEEQREEMRGIDREYEAIKNNPSLSEDEKNELGLDNRNERKDFEDAAKSLEEEIYKLLGIKHSPKQQ